MKWVIEILNNRLRQMNDAYEKYVLNGNVNTDSPNAVENRKKAKQLSNAIKILSATVNTSDGQLTIPAVIPSVCDCCVPRPEDPFEYDNPICEKCGLPIKQTDC
jgi:hypothetical protein